MATIENTSARLSKMTNEEVARELLSNKVAQEGLQVVEKQLKAECVRRGMYNGEIYTSSDGRKLILGDVTKKDIDQVWTADNKDDPVIGGLLLECALRNLLKPTVGFCEEHEELKDAIILKEIAPAVRITKPKKKE